MSGCATVAPFGDVFGMVASLRIDDLGAGADGVQQRAGSSSTATDEADLDGELFAERGVDVRSTKRRERGRAGDGGCLEEVTAGDSVARLFIGSRHLNFTGRRAVELQNNKRLRTSSFGLALRRSLPLGFADKWVSLRIS